MFSGFSSLFEVPSTRRLTIFGFFGRMTIGMRMLAVLLFVESESDSYWAAGTVVAAMTFAQAMISPVLGRASDAVGAVRVLVGTACFHSATGTCFVLAVLHTNSNSLMLISAVLTGLSVAPVGALVRSQWAALLHERPDLLRSAYAVESSLDEVIYIGGPIIAVALAHFTTSTLGVVGTIFLTVAGTLALGFADVLKVSFEQSTQNKRRIPRVLTLDVLKMPGVLVVLTGYWGLGIFLGAADIAVVATTDVLARPHLAGTVLAVMGLASLCASLTMGVMPRGWKLRPVRLISGILIIGASMGTLALWLPSMAQFTLLIAIAGLAIAPTLVMGAARLRALSPTRRMNETFTWASSTITLGLGAGSFAAGWLIDNAGVEWVFLLAAGAGLLITFSGTNDFRERS